LSGGHYGTFLDNASLIVLAVSASLILGVQAIAWAFGYKKQFADEAESA
jgi:hypothetical protein